MKNIKQMWTNLAYTLEDWRISLHLRKAEIYLRNTSINTLSEKTQNARKQNLALLRGYRQAGRFPRNNSINRPTPFFKDDNGTLCAVAHLVAVSGEHELVDQVAQNSNNAAIKDVKSAVFDEWAEKSGLTKSELALIQPAYPTLHLYLFFVFLILGAINLILCLINVSNIRVQRKNVKFSLASLMLSLTALYLSVELYKAPMYRGLVSISEEAVLRRITGFDLRLVIGAIIGGVGLGISLSSLLMPAKK